MEPRPFFCQLEAIETLIWLTESAEADRQGLWGEFDDQLRGDGGPFERVCTKLCTGGGKTKVMAMLIAWHACNKANYPQDKRFCRDFLIVAPNLTVRDRLAGLDPADGGEYGGYLVPDELAGALSQAHVRILNWQAMQWEDEKKLAKKKTVDKRGPLSDKAYAKQVLGPELAKAPRILVLNDEAHHAWRLPPKAKAGDYKGVGEEKDEHTVWVGGLDRIHRVIPILRCHDFSATPFIPSGKMSKEDFLFGWIVSDFGLNDGIEAGLVKTPRMPYNAAGEINPETGLPELYDLYEAKGVKEAIAEDVEASTPLPPTLANAYSLLAEDWRRTADKWRQAGAPTPPVLISVVNNTVTAERIERHFRAGGLATLGQAQELCDEARLLRIDSKALEKAGAAGEALRRRVATVGRAGEPGADVTNLISVAMLSEGWDARTVTHILGLRAFTSQLLCEQVIGRGLRRVSYDVDEKTGLLQPEYVQVFGVPLGRGQGRRPAEADLSHRRGAGARGRRDRLAQHHPHRQEQRPRALARGRAGADARADPHGLRADGADPRRVDEGGGGRPLHARHRPGGAAAADAPLHDGEGAAGEPGLRGEAAGNRRAEALRGVGAAGGGLHRLGEVPLGGQPLLAAGRPRDPGGALGLRLPVGHGGATPAPAPDAGVFSRGG